MISRTTVLAEPRNQAGVGMFITQGPLSKLEFTPHDNPHKMRRSRERAAILYFCSIVNLKGLAYHPTFVRDRIPDEENFPLLGFTPRAIFVNNFLKEGYKKALEKHVENKSVNDLPNQILFKQHGKGQYSLSWSSVGLEIQFVLVISRRATPNLRIIGQWGPHVIKIARQCGLPDPHAKSRDPIFHMLQNERNEREKFASFGEVKVPLGDLIEFLKKYGYR